MSTRVPAALATAAALTWPGSGAEAATEFTYAVKFTCGAVAASDNPQTLVPGTYRTSISVANPNDEDVEFSYDVAFTFGRVPFSEEEDEIGDGDARRIDCDVLFPDTLAGTFLKGVVQVVAEKRLDVWAVYTARGVGSGASISIDSEQVLGRKLTNGEVGKLGE